MAERRLDEAKLPPSLKAAARTGILPVQVSFNSSFTQLFDFLAAVEALPLVRAAVTDHVECMLGRLPLEVTTSDQHEIARWLQRRLARPVVLPTLAPEGTGTMSTRTARLANVGGSQILFDRRGRMLSLFIMPAAEVSSVPGRRVAQGAREFFVSQVEGYVVVFWRQGDLVYCLVGDGEVEGVLSLAREYAGSASG
jgi:anti-sigma factor RsiW